MKTKVKSVLSVLAMVSALSISADGFAKTKGGNGDGYSGPTLNGDAIAMNLDKGVRGTTLRKIYKKCLYPEKKDNLLIQTLKPILQVETIKEDKIYFTNEIEVNDSGKNTLKVNFKATIYGDTSFFGHYNSVDNLFGEINGSELTITQRSRPASRLEIDFKERSFLATPVPSLSFAKKTRSDLYDRLTGDLIEEDYIYEKIKVAYDFQNTEAYPRLINMSTKQTVELTFPSAELAQCIVDELGKL